MCEKWRVFSCWTEWLAVNFFFETYQDVHGCYCETSLQSTLFISVRKIIGRCYSMFIFDWNDVFRNHLKTFFLEKRNNSICDMINDSTFRLSMRDKMLFHRTHLAYSAQQHRMYWISTILKSSAAKQQLLVLVVHKR